MTDKIDTYPYDYEGIKDTLNKATESGVFTEKDNAELQANLDEEKRIAEEFKKEMKEPGKHYREVAKTLNIRENVAIVSENDRLYAYQILRNVIFDKFSSVGAEDFLQQTQMDLAKAVWRSAYQPSFEQAKVWSIDEEQIPFILHSDSRYDEHLPFPSIIINAIIPIRSRIYHGIFVGSFYTDEYKYRLLMSVYKQMIRRDDKEVEVWGMEFFPIDSVANDDFGLKNLTYFQKRLKNFIFSFCNYINEPEVVQISMPVNPNNNKHRLQRGKLPLPEYKRTIVQGKLKVYLNKVTERVASIRSNNQFETWVRGTYMHFRNKQRYRKLYALSELDLQRLDYSVYDGIIRKWKKPQVRNKGKPKIKQEWEVK